MDLDIKANEKNEVLKRQEIVAETSEKITPSKEAVQEKLAAKLNVPKEQIVVNKIKTGFGEAKAVIYARAYDSEDQMRSVEAKYVVSRNFPSEAKEEEKEAATAEPAEGKNEEKGEEAKPEAPKEEKAEDKKEKEENKEEPKAEEKPKEEKAEEKKEDAPKEEKKKEGGE